MLSRRDHRLHNMSPARVFLGDTGSLLLGMILSVLLIYLVGAHETGFSAATLFFVAGFPIIDVSVAMIRRFFRSFFADKGIYQSIRAMTVADSEHTHHRLVYRGLNHTQSVLILATFSATLCIAAILIRLFPGYKYFFEVYSAIIIVSFLYRLNYFDRFTKAIRNRIHHGNKKGLFRIGVVDAAVFYHAMINYNQRKFSMEFISRTEINANDSILGVQLQPAMHLHDQFMISSIWPTIRGKFLPHLFPRQWRRLPRPAHGRRTALEIFQGRRMRCKPKTGSIPPSLLIPRQPRGRGKTHSCREAFDRIIVHGHYFRRRDPRQRFVKQRDATADSVY